jgi:hypothetical protein
VHDHRRLTAPERGARRRAPLLVLGVIVAAAVLAASSSAVRKPPPTDARPVVVQVDRGGFDWTDAAIGSAATLAFVLVLAAVALTRMQRDD